MKFDFPDFLKEIDNYRSCHPNQRYGQAFMNVLFDKNQRIYNIILGTEYDPFYDEKKVEAAKEKVRHMSSFILNESV